MQDSQVMTVQVTLLSPLNLSLPNFEFVAKLADGRFVKGIFPVIDVEKTYKENFI